MLMRPRWRKEVFGLPWEAWLGGQGMAWRLYGACECCSLVIGRAHRGLGMNHGLIVEAAAVRQCSMLTE